MLRLRAWCLGFRARVQGVEVWKLLSGFRASGFWVVGLLGFGVAVWVLGLQGFGMGLV